MTAPFNSSHFSSAAPIIGSKSGGGKNGSTSNDKNTLRSRARVRLVDLISEGPIVGIVGETKGVFLDETAVQNEAGNFNIEGLTFEQRTGLPDQMHLTGMSAVETPIAVDTQVKKGTGPVIRTIVDSNVDAVRVIMKIPALFHNTDKGIKSTSVSYAIDVRAYGGDFVEKVVNNISNEKCTSPTQIAHRIPLPANGSPWDIRVRRITDDTNDDELQNDTYFDSIYQLIEGKFIYPNSAVVYLEADAEKFGSSVPQRAYRVRGLIVQVPSNYDPINRTYQGLWDGTFKNAWTNNPAWIFYDILTNDRYGLGEFVDASIIDKWSLYRIAQYCDELVPTGFTDVNGNKTYEPRYVYNGVLNSREEAFNVITNIASTFRGMAFWAIGQVFVSADIPADPLKIAAPANAVNGEFEYQGTSMKSRHSVALVAWNDPQDFYKPAVEVVINEEMLQRYGWRETTVQAYGCTSRGQAHRIGKWKLDIEQNETETIEYEAPWDHAEVRPGDIVAVSDPRKAQTRAGGRMVSCVNQDEIVIDGDFTPSEGEDHNFMVVMPDGKIETRKIASFDYETVDGPKNSTNLIALSSAVKGIIGDTGKLPTKWFAEIPDTVSLRVSGNGRLNEQEYYIDLQIYGTNNTNQVLPLKIWLREPGSHAYTQRGDKWMLGAGLARVSGSFEGFSGDSVFLRLAELRDSTPIDLASVYGPISDDVEGQFISFLTSIDAFTLTTAIDNYNKLALAQPGASAALALSDLTGHSQRVEVAHTIQSEQTNTVSAYLDFGIEPGATVSLVLRIINPQLTPGEILTDYVPVTGFRRLKLSEKLSADPVVGAMWVITGADVQPRQYRVISIKEASKSTFRITGLFHDPNKYARIEQDIILEPRSYTRTANTIDQPENVNAFESQYIGPDGTAHSRVSFSWSAGPDLRALSYDVQVRTPDRGLIDYGEIRTKNVDVDDAVAGAYTVYLTAVSYTGARSPQLVWTYVAAGWDVNGIPAPVENFTVSVVGDNAYFSWSPVKRFNMSHYVVKYTPALTGAFWGASTVVIPYATGVNATAPARTGSYLIKAVTSNGIESEKETLVVVETVDNLANVVETITAEPIFSGAKTNCFALHGMLSLCDATPLASWPTIGSIEKLAYGFDGVESIGYYECDNIVDLGSAFTCRLSTLIEGVGENLLATLNKWVPLSSADPISGASSSSWSAEIQVSVTLDDPHQSSAVWSDWLSVGFSTVKGRGFKMRLVLTTSNPNVTPLISKAEMVVDMPDMTLSDKNIVCETYGTRVSFPYILRHVRGIAITAQSLSAGDYHVISNKDETGFGIRFFDSSGTPVSRTFDYVANGYGRSIV